FVAVTDPVTAGLVERLARPGGNATGFLPAELRLGAKWLQVLKEMVPTLTRVGVFHNPANSGSVSQFAVIQAAAPSLGLGLSVIDTADKSAVEQAVAAFASSPNGGLLALRIGENISRRDSLFALAAQFRFPAIYPLRPFATAG